MGWTFGNLHIQKNAEITGAAIVEKLKTFYAQFGYAACEEEEAELSLAVLEDSDSDWISVYSDFFEDPQDREALGRWLSHSEMLRVLDIGCFDSDVLGLILYNPEDEEPAQAATGFMARDMGLSIEHEEGWQKIVFDMDGFCEIIDAEHVLAEEAMDDLAGHLRLPRNDVVTDLELLDETAGEANVSRLYLSRRK